VRLVHRLEPEFVVIGIIGELDRDAMARASVVSRNEYLITPG
jgi:hypothetical protein